MTADDTITAAGTAGYPGGVYGPYSRQMPRRRQPWTGVAAERALGEKLEKAARQLRQRRLARKLSQAALAKELGVAANTIARWERCELPIPHWVALYQALQDKLAKLDSVRAEKEEAIRKLRETLATKDFELATVKADLKATRAEKQSFRDLERKVRDMRFGQLGLGGPTAEDFLRALAKAFHPDRHPEHAETMKTVNEIYQRIRRV
jgi:transcriptional regulator with XRE-family HTH domain